MISTAEHALQTGYQAAHQGAVLVDRSNLGLLKFSGETRLDLINRMSTNEVVSLQQGEGRATVLTTDIGRIIDRLILYADREEVYALTGAGFADEIARYLMRFVFFNDDFHIQDLSDATAVWGVYGQQAASILAQQTGVATGELPLHHWRWTTLGEIDVSIHRTDPVAGDGFLVMCPEEQRQPVTEALIAAGLLPVAEEIFEYLRIESGLPLLGQEMTKDYIPLETNLWDDVSFTKGCYIGQEIIARMESRGRLAKKLHRLRLEAPVDAGANLRTAEGGRDAGLITSVADGPQGILALGYIKTKSLESGERLLAGEKPTVILDAS